MVKITFSGAWPAENRVQALRAVQRTLLDALHLQTDPAYYRIETEPAQARGMRCTSRFSRRAAPGCAARRPTGFSGIFRRRRACPRRGRRS